MATKKKTDGTTDAVPLDEDVEVPAPNEDPEPLASEQEATEKEK